MTGRLTSWQTEKWLEEIADSTWMALHFDNPDVASEWNSEVFGGGYSRQLASMYMPNDRALWNSGIVSFNGLPSVMVTHVCGWDSAIKGNMRFSIALPVPLRVIDGGQYSFGAGSLAISLD
jgi:hypothetical protein